MRLYGRRYRLELSKVDEYLVVEKLRIAFELTKSADSAPNEIKVSIWNLSRERIDQLLRGDFQSARLWAGYEELRLLFLADIIKVGVKREGLDWIVELECGDGDRDYHQSYVSQTLSAGTSCEQMVGVALASMPDTSAGQLELSRPQRLPRARVLFGPTRDVLTDLAGWQDADWSIQDGQLQMLPRDRVLDDELILLSEETGMLGSPQLGDDGLTITCLLNPALRVGGQVRLVSRLDWLNGDYKIVRIHYKGDALEQDWKSTVTVVNQQIRGKPGKERGND
ncbi:TPA: phage protein [Pseudomonas aeruginosa]